MKISHGASSFPALRARGAFYGDRSPLCRELLECGDTAVLLARPPGFGKSMSLSLLRAYWEKRDEEQDPALFAGLAVAADDELRQQPRRPVIHLSFKELRHRHLEDVRDALLHRVAAEFERHAAALAWANLSPSEVRQRDAVLHQQAGPVALCEALLLLSRLLHRGAGQPVLLLIDDCDVPLCAGWAHGYLEGVTELLRHLLGAVLQDNEHLWQALLTATLPQALLPLGLATLTRYALSDGGLSHGGGLRAADLEALLPGAAAESVAGLVQGCGGYRCGGQDLLDPAVLLRALQRPELLLCLSQPPLPSADPLQALLLSALRAEAGAAADLEALLAGEVLERPLQGGHGNGEALTPGGGLLWGLLVALGLLVGEDREARSAAVSDRLRVPNLSAQGRLRGLVGASAGR